MERSEATHQAFDGVELRLLNGRVVHVPAFSTAEAVHFLRLFSEVQKEATDAESEARILEAHAAFVREFAVRAQLLAVPLADLGLALELPDHTVVRGEGLTVRRVLELLSVLHEAAVLETKKVWFSRRRRIVRTGWEAQLQFLEEFPPAVGIGEELPPGEAFAIGHALKDEFFRILYGLARDFLSHLRSTPRAQVMELIRGPTEATTSSTPGSTS